MIRRLKKRYVYQAQTPDEISFRVDDVSFPSGRVGRYVFAEYAFEVCHIMSVTDDGRLVFIEQFRYPLRQTLVETPAGSPLPGESLLECARREATEETGLYPNHVVDILSFNPSPGSSDAVAHLFIGSGLIERQVQKDPDEATSVLLLSLEEARQMLFSRAITHVGAVVAILFLSSPDGAAVLNRIRG